MQTVKQQYQNELSEISRAKELESNRIKANYDSINNEYLRLKKENNDLQSKLARSSDTIEQQKAHIATLKNQLEQLKTNRDSIDKLNTLKAPILELAKILSRDRAILPIREPKVSVLKKIKSLLKTTIPFLNLFFAILIFVTLTGRTKSSTIRKTYTKPVQTVNVGDAKKYLNKNSTPKEGTQVSNETNKPNKENDGGSNGTNKSDKGNDYGQEHNQK